MTSDMLWLVKFSVVRILNVDQRGSGNVEEVPYQLVYGIPV